jgi:hypothetical protein
MPAQKDLKRLVRARMKKTGEAYTTARKQILTKRPSTKSAPAATTARAAKPASALVMSDYAKVAGMSDAVLKEKTGCTWDAWVGALDYYGAAEMSHRDIAKLVGEKFKVGDWWTQTVTVGYERIKGLRTRGQQRDGTFGATKSRTYSVPVETLFDAWMKAKTRNRWLTDAKVRVRVATAPKSMRLDWPDGSIIAVGFTSKGSTKSAVALEHTRLADRDAANRVKQEWGERLDALGEILADASS